MSRLILVPQYPTKMRYQEWWWDQFPMHLNNWFDEVIVLGANFTQNQLARYAFENFRNICVKTGRNFAPLEKAIEFETYQINCFMELNLKPDDVLLLNDLSFPGLFANVLFHKRPKKCFAICHATSKNAYDYFAKDRKMKYPIEKAQAKLFERIFVGSQYHADKLGWDNITVLPLPNPPYDGYICQNAKKLTDIIVVSRLSRQKRNLKFEKEVERQLGIKIEHSIFNSWQAYYKALSEAKIMLITSNEETYGYQVIDAVLNDCIPIAPNKFSYPDLLSVRYLYDDLDDLIWLIEHTLKRPWSPLLVSSESVNFYDHLAQCMRYD